jgi:polyvinyl alcohol dehydrogenase (cytochrome)
MKLRSLRATALALTLVGLAAPAFAQTPPARPVSAANKPNDALPGKPLFDRVCATCHTATPADPRAASFANLTAMAAAELRDAMNEGGKMAPMAASFSTDEKAQIVAYLTSGQTAAPTNWTEALMCAADNRTVDVSKPVAFAGFGGTDLTGRRQLSANEAGLTTAEMKNLDVAWAIGFPNTASVSTGLTQIGDTGFLNAAGTLLALDVKMGCARWTKKINSRNTPAVGVVSGKSVLAFAVQSDIVMLDAKTGETIWQASGQPSVGRGSIRGGVIIYKDKVIVPLSASGVIGSAPNDECCVGHGDVVALSAADGKRVWEYHTMPEAEYTGRVNSKGKKQKGPSGAPIWSVPIIDAKRNHVIVTTGENTSHPGTDTSDAVIALDIDTGKVAWQFQAMKLDIWNMQCNNNKTDSGANCPWTIEGDEGHGRDFDFGAGAILAKGAGGKDIILAGQKSGDVWALDAVTGKKIWNTRLGKGTALGGVHWGIATDGARVFAAINDPVLPGQTEFHPGIYAIDVKTGKQVWGYDAKADCDGARKAALVNCETKYGFSTAPLVVDGAVIGATLDGKTFVFDSKTGAILRQFDFAGPIATINGVPAKGGSFDAHAIAAGNGMIFLANGYGQFSQSPGNTLIALKPKK